MNFFLVDSKIPHYQFKHLAALPEITHAVLKRDFNIGIDCKRDDGIKNRKILATALDIDDLISAHQMHDTAILEIEAPRQTDFAEIEGYDALITQIEGVGLLIKVADCQGLIFYDPETKTIAAVHAGWRGAVKEIVPKTLALLKTKYKVNPKNLLVGITPSLGPDCAKFSDPYNEIPEAFHPYISKDNTVDLWRIVDQQLLNAGIPEQNIVRAKICTHCHPDEFYSYRVNKKGGRFGVVIKLNKS